MAHETIDRRRRPSGRRARLGMSTSRVRPGLLPSKGSTAARGGGVSIRIVPERQGADTESSLRGPSSRDAGFIGIRNRMAWATLVASMIKRIGPTIL